MIWKQIITQKLKKVKNYENSITAERNMIIIKIIRNEKGMRNFNLNSTQPI
jgi:hypothetical protein